MMPRFSICIPTWEQHGVGIEYLDQLLVSIFQQTFKDYEIIISDHSKNSDIYDLVKNLPVSYFKYNEKYGNGVSNTNNAIKNAKGEIIKIMFQDDLMFSKNCLQILNDNYTKDVEWMVCGCNHTNNGIDFSREMIPSWNDDILFGNNTISSPSVLSFRNKNVELFDEDLKMLMDVEYYFRLYTKHGLPKIIPNILISNRTHQYQISSTYDGNIDLEILHVKTKYNK